MLKISCVLACDDLQEELLDLVLKAARLGRVAGQDGFLKLTWTDLAFLVHRYRNG